MEKWVAYGDNIRSADWPTIGIGAGTLAVLIVWPRISRRVPGPFVAMLMATIVVRVFHLPVETRRDAIRVGAGVVAASALSVDSVEPLP